MIFLFVATSSASAQISTPDDRYKADILLIVAHPDDDTVVSSYLARAIFDQHKRVAVVFCTPGDSGSNSTGREHARALGVVREIEARRAMSALGITNVWFLNGRDTASQDVLLSLATWPSASILEQAVRIVRADSPGSYDDLAPQQRGWREPWRSSSFWRHRYRSIRHGG